MIENREGQRVPQVTFRTRTGSDWKDVTSGDVFAGRKVIVFSLPGAFTPTCSSTHVPRYNQLAPTFRKHGVDDIVCVSVNDAFVMNEWKKSQDAGNVTFLPDGNGEFTAGMDMLVDKEELGFGKRSWRYSMLVDDGIISKMFIEPQQPGDPFGESDADTMLKWIAPDESEPLNVTVFSREGCPHCARARNALRTAGIDFDVLELNSEYSERTLRAISGAAVVPQVFVNGVRIGGADELEAWLRRDQGLAA